jgi:hemoglobin/transferrin/lactoferrin receptor protein
MKNLTADNQGVLPAVNTPSLPVFLFACLALSVDCAAANDSSAASADAYDLDEIIVTASRRSENVFSVPYAVAVLGMRELQEYRQVRTLPDALRELAGVMVQKTGHGQGSPYIRGFTGLRTLFLIDGIRLNNSTFREGPNQYWNTVDPFSIYRLELVKGPSLVLYGSDAIGGAVNAINRSYSDIYPAAGTRSRVVVRGASAEHSVLLRPEAGYANGRFEVLGGVSLKEFGDLHVGEATGNQPKTGYAEQNADVKVNIDLGDKGSLVAAVQHFNQDDAWRTHKTVLAKAGGERRPATSYSIRSINAERSPTYSIGPRDRKSTRLNSSH